MSASIVALEYFPLAGARGVEPLGRGPATTFAALLADRRAIGETE